jgi:hypothetical protein
MQKKRAFHLDFGVGTLMTTWILRELKPSYNSILCMLKERTNLVTIQKICVEFFIQIDQGCMLKECNLLWMLSQYLEIKCLVIHVVLCQSLSLILGLQRSKCGWVGGCWFTLPWGWGIFLSPVTNLCSDLVTIHVLNNYHGYSHQGYTRKNKVNVHSNFWV